MTYFYTRTTDDTATLAEDTRGKQYFFPGYDPNDPTTPGPRRAARGAVGAVRDAQLHRARRPSRCSSAATTSCSRRGSTICGMPRARSSRSSTGAPRSARASSNQPDQRQFGSIWVPSVDSGGTILPAAAPRLRPGAEHQPRQLPAHLGDDRRGERAVPRRHQAAVQATGPRCEGYLKIGVFHDQRRPRVQPGHVQQLRRPERRVRPASWEDPWSCALPGPGPPDHRRARPTSTTRASRTSRRSTRCSTCRSRTRSGRSAACASSRRSSASSTTPRRDAVWFPPGTRLDHAAQSGRRRRRTSARTTCCRRSMLEYKPVDQVIFRGRLQRDDRAPDVQGAHADPPAGVPRRSDLHRQSRTSA